MEKKERVVGAIQRLLADEELRRRLLTAPREVMMAELGISGETYRALMSIVPVVLAGTLYLLSSSIEPGLNSVENTPWGGWGGK